MATTRPTAQLANGATIWVGIRFRQRGQWHYLVYTYDGVNRIRVYADGLPNNTRTLTGLNTWAGMPIRIGAQSIAGGTDFDFGQAFSGDIAMVRVHSGQLSDGDVTNNFFYGAELTLPGELQGVNLALSASTLIGRGVTGRATVTANYASRNYLIVNGFSTFQSSDTNIVTVDGKGEFAHRGGWHGNDHGQLPKQAGHGSTAGQERPSGSVKASL